MQKNATAIQVWSSLSELRIDTNVAIVTLRRGRDITLTM